MNSLIQFSPVCGHKQMPPDLACTPVHSLLCHWCDVRPMVTYTNAELSYLLAGTKLHCLVREAHVDDQGYTRRHSGWEWNSWPLDHKFDALPLCYLATKLLLQNVMLICYTTYNWVGQWFVTFIKQKKITSDVRAVELDCVAKKKKRKSKFNCAQAPFNWHISA